MLSPHFPQSTLIGQFPSSRPRQLLLLLRFARLHVVDAWRHVGALPLVESEDVPAYSLHHQLLRQLGV